MQTVENLDEQYKQFIEFGNIFDKPTRRYITYYLQNKIDRKPPSLSHRFNSPQFDYLKEALDQIFSDAKMLKVTNGNEHLSSQIIHDTLQWMRKSQQEINKNNPCQDEFNRLQSWKDRPLQIYADTWYHLTNFLKETYTREQIDISFYEERLDDIFRDKARFLASLQIPSDEKLPIDLLLDDLLKQWEQLLIEKSLRYEMEEMHKQAEQFTKLLYAKVEEYEQMYELIAPFAMEAGRFWDMSRGLWKQTNFDLLQKYSQLLNNEKSIRELADLLGRMREAQTEIEEELYEYAISKAAWRTTSEHKSEIGGIYESDDLNYLLPAEAVLLADPVTETAFYKKYADKNLLTFQYQGREMIKGEGTTTGIREKTRRKEKGPFIVCVDASASMEGMPEYIAKVLCFAILKMAAKEQRKCYLISFSTGLQTINLLELESSLDQVVKFLSMTFNGGTDIHPPMFEAMNMLQSRDYTDADVLMISDFIMYEMRDELIKRMKAEQKKGTRFHSLTITTQANPAIVELFDNYWVYDPESKEIARQLAKDLKKIT
ncbi:VWA domain-containing protein [Rhodocytophaga rosea]|uniref:VWA domain-containing protein n=1 Tax=Rhodocytophaga rosea TaxID=2704465 RepID=A0A6C0GTA2_9BACT|nr:VWA domain-containing protein [Rhodocytophaga rosea]QHT71398.1 VWA domain-containing protein [Rhodocytophaga rosea]